MKKDHLHVTRRRIRFAVNGVPQQQGSKTARVYPIRDLESALHRILQSPNPRKKFMATVKAGLFDANSKKLDAWRKQVTSEAFRAMRQQQHMQPIDVAVEVAVNFYFERPKNHFGTGRNADKLKESAREYPSVKPDIDKLLRAVLDSMSGVVFNDDCQVVKCTVSKGYAEAGVSVIVSAVEDELLEANPF